MPLRSRIRRTRRARGQGGYVLLMVLLALAVMVIAMTAVAPTLKTQIQRERENEMIHRGEQYARAVRRYYRKFGRYPSRLEELDKTNNIRFIRKKYKDPMSEDGSWRLVHLSDLKLTPALNIGQPAGALQQPTGSQSTFNNGFGQTGNSSFGSQGAGSLGRNPSSPSGSPIGTSGTTTPSSTDAGSSAFGSQVFGGGPLLGVASTVDKLGLHEFNGKANYRDWLFIYVPAQDRGGLIKGPYNPNAFKQGGVGGGPGSPISPTPNGMPNLISPFGSGDGTTHQFPSPPPDPSQLQPQH